MATFALRLAKAFHQPILDHCRLAAPLLDGLFDGTPLVCAAYPRGLRNYRFFHGPLGTPSPAGLRTIDVAGAQGVHTYLALTKSAMDWVLGHTSTVEFHGWLRCR